MEGTVVVIASGGAAYDLMAQAWLASWRRQHRAGLHLLLVRGGGTGTVRDLPAPAARELVSAHPETLVPGVLDKTLEALGACGGGWVFRTNLSSHVDLEELARLMAGLRPGWALGYSPTGDHLCGAGLGLTPGAVRLVVESRGQLDRTVVDDLAISRLLFAAGGGVLWTGRLDRVWPDGTHLLGSPPLYHVRVKTLDRFDDARVLRYLAEHGIAQGARWIFSGCQ